MRDPAADGAPIRSLYLCYFGVEQPLVQTQVLPYLRELTGGGVRATLLTFEPTTDARWRREVAPVWRERLAAAGLGWDWLRYHKRPTVPATLYDVAQGAWRARRIARRERVDLLHARSHVACLMAAVARAGTRRRVIFDVRGLLAEEYVEGGVWPEGGALYRWTKRVERALFRASDGFVVLSDRGRDFLLGSGTVGTAGDRPFEVIPCCVDLDRFTLPDQAARTAAKARLGFAGRRVVVHIGAIDGWVPTQEAARVMAAAYHRDPRTTIVVLTQSPTAPAMQRALEAEGVVVDGDRCVIRGAAPDAVPAYLQAADVGLALYKAGVAKVCSSPTRLAEYLASGVPVLGSAGIGDMDTVIVDDRTGVVLTAWDPATVARAWADMETLERDPNLPTRCRRSAETRFHLREIAGARYRRLYRRVMGRDA